MRACGVSQPYGGSQLERRYGDALEVLASRHDLSKGSTGNEQGALSHNPDSLHYRPRQLCSRNAGRHIICAHGCGAASKIAVIHRARGRRTMPASLRNVGCRRPRDVRPRDRPAPSCTVPFMPTWYKKCIQQCNSSQNPEFLVSKESRFVSQRGMVRRYPRKRLGPWPTRLAE